jgi:hypothetical protein
MGNLLSMLGPLASLLGGGAAQANEAPVPQHITNPPAAVAPLNPGQVEAKQEANRTEAAALAKPEAQAHGPNCNHSHEAPKTDLNKLMESLKALSPETHAKIEAQLKGAQEQFQGQMIAQVTKVIEAIKAAAAQQAPAQAQAPAAQQTQAAAQVTLAPQAPANRQAEQPVLATSA